MRTANVDDDASIDWKMLNENVKFGPKSDEKTFEQWAPNTFKMMKADFKDFKQIMLAEKRCT